MDFGSLTGWDYLLALVLGISVLIGLIRGMIRTVFALGAWVVALLGAPQLAPLAIEYSGFQDRSWIMVVLVFIVLFVLVRLLGALVSKAINGIGLGGADRLAGGLFGVLRALVLVALLVAAARLTGMDQDQSWQKAYSRPLLEAIAEVIDPYLSAQPERQIRLREPARPLRQGLADRIEEV
jgi:membrane protein required for colicin V production